MQHIDIIAVGRVRERYLTAGIDEYLKRGSRYFSLRLKPPGRRPVPRGDLGAAFKGGAEKLAVVAIMSLQMTLQEVK